MDREQFSRKTRAAFSLIFSLLLAAMALPHVAELLLPSCITSRIGCMGEPVLTIFAIRAGTILLAAGTLYLAMKYAPGMAGRRSS